MYKVIKAFHDLQDVKKTKNGEIYHEYHVGDEFPRKGIEVSKERIEELAGSNNKQREPLIKIVEENAETKDVEKNPVAKKATSK